jgi:hypothetical protein
VASTYWPTDNSRNAFLELTRHVREDHDGGIGALNDALGSGVRLILTHRTAKDNVDDAATRVLELTAKRLRASEIEPEGIPPMVVSLIHQCAAGRIPVSTESCDGERENVA